MVRPEYSVPIYDLYGERKKVQNFRFIHVEPLHVRNRRENWCIKPHYHPDLDQLSVVLTGACTYVLDGTKLSMRGASSVFMRAGVVHSFEYEPGSTGYIVTCSRDLTEFIRSAVPGVSEVQQLLLSEQGCPLRNVDLVARIATTCELLRTYSRPPDREFIDESLNQISFLWLLLKRAAVADRQHGMEIADTHRKLFIQFRKILRESFQWTDGDTLRVCNARTVEYFSGLLEVSPYQLNKCCLITTGRTAKQLILDDVVSASIRLLLYSSGSIREISEFLGYSSPSHFIRFFSKKQGMTPNAFRSKHVQAVAI